MPEAARELRNCWRWRAVSSGRWPRSARSGRRRRWRRRIRACSALGVATRTGERLCLRADHVAALRDALPRARLLALAGRLARARFGRSRARARVAARGERERAHGESLDEIARLRAAGAAEQAAAVRARSARRARRSRRFRTAAFARPTRCAHRAGNAEARGRTRRSRHPRPRSRCARRSRVSPASASKRTPLALRARNAAGDDAVELRARPRRSWRDFRSTPVRLTRRLDSGCTRRRAHRRERGAGCARAR